MCDLMIASDGYVKYNKNPDTVAPCTRDEYEEMKQMDALRNVY